MKIVSSDADAEIRRERKMQKLAEKAYKAVDAVFGKYGDEAIASSGYVTELKFKMVNSSKAEVSVVFGGRVDRKGVGSKVLPFKYDPDSKDDREAISRFLDDVEFELAERLTRWDSLEIRRRREPEVFGTRAVMDTFTVMKGKGK